MKGPRIIAFDSGEGTTRRRILEGFLQYLLGVKGVKCVCLSVDPVALKAYLALLPPRLKTEVYSRGLFQVYLSVLNDVSELQEKLYIDPRHNQILFDLFDRVLFPLQDQLVKQLTEAGIVVILDRSRLTTYSYHACLPTFKEADIESTLKLAESYLHQEGVWSVFVDSPKRLAYNILTARKYDLIAPELNLKLTNWFKNLENRTGKNLIYLPNSINLQDAVIELRKIFDD